MATVILKWNPNFSSYSMFRYLHDIVVLNHQGYGNFNWSVWDYDKVHAGDRFYFVKLGYGATGIIGTGHITSDPYVAEDWTGKGRKTYYADYEPELLLNPDALPILTNMMLTARIPDFSWDHGHSGLVLNEEQAETLDRLWTVFMKEHSDEFSHKNCYEGRENDYIYWNTRYYE